MKKIIVFFGLALITILFIGYYESVGEAESDIVFFIKKQPTLQVKFVNISDPNFDKRVHDLSSSERQQMIKYCKYRLGIETWLDTETELEACTKR